MVPFNYNLLWKRKRRKENGAIGRFLWRVMWILACVNFRCASTRAEENPVNPYMLAAWENKDTRRQVSSAKHFFFFVYSFIWCEKFLSLTFPCQQFHSRQREFKSADYWLRACVHIHFPLILYFASELPFSFQTEWSTEGGLAERKKKKWNCNLQPRKTSWWAFLPCASAHSVPAEFTWQTRGWRCCHGPSSPGLTDCSTVPKLLSASTLCQSESSSFAFFNSVLQKCSLFSTNSISLLTTSFHTPSLWVLCKFKKKNTLYKTYVSYS